MSLESPTAWVRNPRIVYDGTTEKTPRTELFHTFQPITSMTALERWNWGFKNKNFGLFFSSRNCSYEHPRLTCTPNGGSAIMTRLFDWIKLSKSCFLVKKWQFIMLKRWNISGGKIRKNRWSISNSLTLNPFSYKGTNNEGHPTSNILFFFERFDSITSMVSSEKKYCPWVLSFVFVTKLLFQVFFNLSVWSNLLVGIFGPKRQGPFRSKLHTHEWLIFGVLLVLFSWNIHSQIIDRTTFWI